jgi:hypothetical protein
MRKRSWETRQLWVYCRRDYRTTGVLAAPVVHPAYPEPLWLVVARLAACRRERGLRQAWPF